MFQEQKHLKNGDLMNIDSVDTMKHGGLMKRTWWFNEQTSDKNISHRL